MLCHGRLAADTSAHPQGEKQPGRDDGKLSGPLQRTHDAMVAWELGLIGEKTAQNDEGGREVVHDFSRTFSAAGMEEEGGRGALTLRGCGHPGPAQVKPKLSKRTHESFFTYRANRSGEMPLALGEIARKPPKKARKKRLSHWNRLRQISSAATSVTPSRTRRREGTTSGEEEAPPRAARRPGAAPQGRHHIAHIADASRCGIRRIPAPNAGAPKPWPNRQRNRVRRAGRPPAKSGTFRNRFAVFRRNPNAAHAFEPHRAGTRRRSGTGFAHGTTGVHAAPAGLEAAAPLDQADQAPAGPGVFCCPIPIRYPRITWGLPDARVGLGIWPEAPGAARILASRGYSEAGLKAKLAEHLAFTSRRSLNI